MKVAIVKYNAGNIRSVSFALHRLGIEPVITDDPEELLSADRIIFPGVGEANNTMKHIRQNGLDKVIKSATQPFLGICLGLQLMCKHSEEGNAECLNIFPIEVKKFRPENNVAKVPHMGWNTVENRKGALLVDLPEVAHAYFVHSYYAELSEYTVGTTPYIVPFTSVLHRDNFYATQFHPEKSADIGNQILKNFLNLNDNIV